MLNLYRKITYFKNYEKYGPFVMVNSVAIKLKT